MAWRRLRYRIARRSGWDVLVYPGEVPDYRPRDALAIDNLPTKTAAVERAEHLWEFLSEQDRLPEAGDG